MLATVNVDWRRALPGLLLPGVAVLLGLRALFLFLGNSLPLQLVLGPTHMSLGVALLVELVLGLAALMLELGRLRRGSTGLGWGAALRWALVVCVLSWLLFLVFIPTFQRLWFDLALGLAGGGLASVSLLHGWARGRFPKRLVLVDVVLFSLCTGALGLELGLRVYASSAPSPLFARVGGGPAELVQRFRCEPGEVRFGFACNSRGFYDEEFFRRTDASGPKRVAVVGDSFGVGTVPHAWHYTTITEELTQMQLDNMGVPGVGPPEYLSLVVEEALPLAPDVVLISLFVGNDLSVEDVLSDLPDAGLRGWLQRDQVLLFVLPERMARVAEEHQRVRSIGAEAGTSTAAQPLAKMNRVQAAQQFPFVADPSLEQESLSTETFLRLEVGRAIDICAQDPVSLDLLRSSLLAAREAAGDIPVAVMIIPDEFQVEDELWKVVSTAAGRPLERDRAQRLLGAWLGEQEFPFLDLLPVLRAAQPLGDGKRHLYHAQDTHFNARGNELTAAALAEFLQTL